MGGIDWEPGIDIYTLLYLRQITNKDLRYNTGNSAWCSVITKTEKECICITKSLCCTCEISTTLLIKQYKLKKLRTRVDFCCELYCVPPKIYFEILPPRTSKMWPYLATGLLPRQSVKKKSERSRHRLHAQLLSRVWLCDPMDCSPPGSSAPTELFRQEYWSGLPFPPSGDLPDPGIELSSPVSPNRSTVGLNPSEWRSYRKTATRRHRPREKAVWSRGHGEWQAEGRQELSGITGVHRSLRLSLRVLSRSQVS